MTLLVAADLTTESSPGSEKVVDSSNLSSKLRPKLSIRIQKEHKKKKEKQKRRRRSRRASNI